MMNAQIMVIVISAVFLIAETQAGIFSSKPKNVISLKLKRLQIDPFIKNSTLSDSSCYNPIKMDSDYQHSYDITPPKQCADQKQLVKIMNQCIFLTTSYQTDLYLGSAQLEPFKMVLDLRSPWSWVKSPFCSQYDRSGTFQAQQCTFPSRIKEIPGNYSSTYACSDGCSRITDKCAEVDLVQEGLSIYGTFISSKIILSDKSFKKEIKEFKLVWAHGLSGQSLLQGDGVLGLGQQHKDAYDFEDSDEDDEVNTSIFERGTDFWSSIKNVYKNVNPSVFALYIAEHDSFTPQLLIGQNVVNYTDLMHDPEQMPIQYIELSELKTNNNNNDNQDKSKKGKKNIESNDSDYFLWQIPVYQITFHYDHITQMSENNVEEIVGYNGRSQVLLNSSSSAILSIQTSAIILPQNMLNSVIDTIYTIYQVNCTLSNNYLKYVYCSQLDEKLNFTQIAITISLGTTKEEGILLNIDPESLFLGCRKQSGKYDCYLNLQLSSDGRIIFGDSVLRHSFTVFDTKERRIGFAPAKSKFNEKSLWNELQAILEDVEDVIRGDILFLFRFFMILIGLSTILFFFVNSQKIWKIIKRRFRYRNISDVSEMANLDLDKSDMVIRHSSDDQDVTDQIQELEQNEQFDAL